MALMLLLLAAVVGPACLAFTASAMASTDSCDDVSLSQVACPHVAAIEAADRIHPLAPAVAALVNIGLEPADAGPVSSSVNRPALRLAQHLTPLRI